MQSKARYIMIGGFLGAGKTTAVARLATRLRTQGLRVGLITNDQGQQLVDTAMLASHGFAVEEIAGGCFCCRFNSLTEAARKLSTETRPDVFIAEPVGSCTDLVATVSYPLRRIYGDQFSIAPLSVLVDPVRARRVLGLETGGSFSEKVIYIYEKQLQEANLIVVNKIDLLDDAARDQLREALTKKFPSKPIVEVSARHERGLGKWFDLITHSEQDSTDAMNIDYGIYGQGEALLGWLNATVHVACSSEFDANRLLSDLASIWQQQLRVVEIAHLKMTLSPDDAFSDVAVINLVRSDAVAELSQELPEPIETGELIINIRAEADPARLREVVTAGLNQLQADQPDLAFEMQHIESFRPGQPQPTHRMTSV